MIVPEPNKERICLFACVVLDVSPDEVFLIWQLVRKYNSWDLAVFMGGPPDRRTVSASRRVLRLSGVLK
jgi:hypothetical protein